MHKRKGDCDLIGCPICSEPNTIKKIRRYLDLRNRYAVNALRGPELNELDDLDRELAGVSIAATLLYHYDELTKVLGVP